RRCTHRAFPIGWARAGLVQLEQEAVMKLATVGYQNDTEAAFIERLKAADVAIVLDVRAVAASRKAGFSKNILAASLAEAGIDYLHLQKLGTPKTGRDAARAGKFAGMRQIYEDHLA